MWIEAGFFYDEPQSSEESLGINSRQSAYFFFFYSLLQFIDEVISNHKERMLLGSDDVLAKKSQSSFNTICIDR